MPGCTGFSNYLKPFWFVIAFVISGVFLSACEDDKSGKNKQKKAQQLVHSLTIKPVDSFLSRRFNAVISAPNTIKISNQIAGMIMQIPYREGRRVKQGDILVQLDDSLTKAEHQKAIASLEKAEMDFQRTKKLVPSKLASDEELSAAQTNLKLAKAELTLKKIQLDRSVIIAPFDGVISQRLFEPGDTVTANTHLLSLVDTSNLVIKSAVPESFLGFIEKNQAVQIDIPALDLQLNASIQTIFPTVDPKTQQVSIEAQFNQQTPPLYPGMFAELTIKQKISNAILIPVNAVQYDTDGSWVYTINEKGKSAKTRVTTGQNINNTILVTTGLNAGDTIITKGFVGLRAGKKVKAVNMSTPDDKPE